MSYPLAGRVKRVLLALVLAVPFFWRLGAEEFHGDESHWTSSGQQVFFLVTSGRFGDPAWSDEFYLFSQPHVGKLLIGASLAVAGYRGPTAIYDYDWQRRPEENRAAGRVPPDDAVPAARVPGAIAGWIGCLLLWTLAVALGAPEAGLPAAILLASHPLWLANARRAGLDTMSLSLGLLAAWAAVRAMEGRTSPPSPLSSEMERGNGPRTAAWWLLAGLALGLAAGAKYVGLLPAALAVVVAVSVLIRRNRARSIAFGGLTAISIAAGVFFATNPTLYHGPPAQLLRSIDFLTMQAGYMRRDTPAFASPPLVALEIVDRAIWPTGYPPIVDRSLPKALIPGSYGTPVVALGAAVALVTLARRRTGDRYALRVAAGWTLVVFVLLTLSVPTWWERWHVPLIPALCLLAGSGLRRLDELTSPPSPLSRGERGDGPPPRSRNAEGGNGSAPPVALAPLPASGRGWGWGLLAGAQYLAALAMGPSYLNRGFVVLVTTPIGAAAHVTALAITLVLLASQSRRAVRLRANWRSE